MSDEFDRRAYLLSFVDREQRARALHESGLAGDPEFADIEAAIASPRGGEYQQLLADQRRPEPPTPKRLQQQFERRCAARPEIYGTKRVEQPQTSTGVALAGPERLIEEEAIVPDGGAHPKRQARIVAPSPELRAFLDQYTVPPKPGSLEEAIGRCWYENRQHIPKPAWYRPAPVVAGDPNPFRRPRRRMRPSDVSAEEAARLYNTLAFGMWQYGELMTAHVVILWETFRVHEHERATEIFSEYLSRAMKWAAVGTVGQPRQRRRERTGEGFKFRYVYVHENVANRGFHTHILCTVPGPGAKSFENWSRKALARLTRHPGDGRSIRVRRSYAKTETAAVQRCWNWFRYIAKQLDPKAGWGRIDEPWSSLRDILQVWPRRHSSLPVTCAQLVGSSQDLTATAQEEAGFQSRLVRGELDELFRGYEMDEWRRHCYLQESMPPLGDWDT